MPKFEGQQQGLNLLMTRRSTLITTFVILIAVIATAIFGAGVYRKMQLDSSSREFAAEVVPLVLTQGVEALQTYAHPDYLEQQPIDSLIKYLYFTSRSMGELELVESISGGSIVPLLIFSKEMPTASYQLSVSFARGPAVVKIDLIYSMEIWQISAFVVDGDYLSD